MAVRTPDTFSGDFMLVSDPRSDTADRGRGIAASNSLPLPQGTPELDANRFTGGEVLRAASGGEAYTVFERVVLEGDDGDLDRIRMGTNAQVGLVLSSPGVAAAVYDALRPVYEERLAGLQAPVAAPAEAALPAEASLV